MSSVNEAGSSENRLVHGQHTSKSHGNPAVHSQTQKLDFRSKAFKEAMERAAKTRAEKLGSVEDSSAKMEDAAKSLSETVSNLVNPRSSRSTTRTGSTLRSESAPKRLSQKQPGEVNTEKMSDSDVKMFKEKKRSHSAVIEDLKKREKKLLEMETESSGLLEAAKSFADAVKNEGQTSSSEKADGSKMKEGVDDDASDDEVTVQSKQELTTEYKEKADGLKDVIRARMNATPTIDYGRIAQGFNKKQFKSLEDQVFDETNSVGVDISHLKDIESDSQYETALLKHSLGMVLSGDRRKVIEHKGTNTDQDTSDFQLEEAEKELKSLEEAVEQLETRYSLEMVLGNLLEDRFSLGESNFEATTETLETRQSEVQEILGRANKYSKEITDLKVRISDEQAKSTTAFSSFCKRVRKFFSVDTLNAIGRSLRSLRRNSVGIDHDLVVEDAATFVLDECGQLLLDDYNKPITKSQIRELKVRVKQLKEEEEALTVILFELQTKDTDENRSESAASRFASLIARFFRVRILRREETSITESDVTPKEK